MIHGQSSGYGGDPTPYKCMVVAPQPNDDDDEFWVHAVDGRPMPGGRVKMRLMGLLGKRPENPLRIGTTSHVQVGNQVLEIPADGDLVKVMYWGYKDGEHVTTWWWGWDED